MIDNWLKQLNPEQREAVLHNEGPQLILAGAGSGKTTVLVTRTGRLIAEKKAKPEQITVMTFTNKAARELKDRVAAKLGPSAKGIWAGTFHSFGLNVLRKYHKLAGLPKQFGILDATDARALVRELGKDLHHSSKQGFDAEKLLSIMASWRQEGRTKAKSEDEYEELTQMLLPKYLKRLELLGVADFDGLLLKPLQIFSEHPHVRDECNDQIKYLMVDEFQDTNLVQLRLVQRLVEDHHNIAVVGDDDQSIYGWRGACVSNILNFPRLYKDCHVVRLERNYRSTPSILKVANEVIHKNSERHAKILKAEAAKEQDHKPELFVYETEEEEADDVVQQIHHFVREGYGYNDIAILYRSNSQGGLIEGSLRHGQIPYALTGGTAFFDRREVRDVIAYIRCALAPNEIAFRRILNTPPRGIGETTVKALEEYSHSHSVSLFKSAKNWSQAGVNEKAGHSIDQLLEQLRQLPDLLLQPLADKTSGQRLSEFFVNNGYYDFVSKGYKDTATAQNRWQLVDILGRILDGFFTRGGRTLKTLKEFIDSMELRDSMDESPAEKDKPKVQMLTLHACKGLEFPVVFIVGVEEDILPHRTLGSDISEERRLFYVGVTRAQERLVLSHARQRKRFGKLRPVAPSRFLLEIPEELYLAHEGGFRPVTEQDRQSMMADLFKKLDSQISNRNTTE